MNDLCFIGSLLIVFLLGTALVYDVAFKRGLRKGTVVGFRTAVTMLAEQVKEEERV